MYRCVTIPQPKIKDFCQPPLHKGAFCMFCDLLCTMDYALLRWGVPAGPYFLVSPRKYAKNATRGGAPFQLPPSSRPPRAPPGVGRECGIHFRLLWGACDVVGYADLGWMETDRLLKEKGLSTFCIMHYALCTMHYGLCTFQVGRRQFSMKNRCAFGNITKNILPFCNKMSKTTCKMCKSRIYS